MYSEPVQVDDLHSDIFRKGKSEDLRGDYNEAKDYNPHPFVDPHCPCRRGHKELNNPRFAITCCADYNSITHFSLGLARIADYCSGQLAHPR